MTIEVSAEDLAQHLNLSADELDEATLAYLAQLSEAAQAHIFEFTGSFDPDADPPVPIPQDVRLAIMLLAAHWFGNRETATPESLSTIPYGVREIIAAHRQWGC